MCPQRRLVGNTAWCSSQAQRSKPIQCRQGGRRIPAGRGIGRLLQPGEEAVQADLAASGFRFILRCRRGCLRRAAHRRHHLVESFPRAPSRQQFLLFSACLPCGARMAQCPPSCRVEAPPNSRSPLTEVSTPTPSVTWSGAVAVCSSTAHAHTSSRLCTFWTTVLLWPGGNSSSRGTAQRGKRLPCPAVLFW